MLDGYIGVVLNGVAQLDDVDVSGIVFRSTTPEFCFKGQLRFGVGRAPRLNR